MKITVKQMVIGGLMIALSVILSLPQFKIMGTIGLDAMPGFFAGAAISPGIGGIVGAVAHLVSALLAGFPFGLPLHLLVTIFMFLSIYAYGYFRKIMNRYVAVVVGIVMNGPVSLAASAMFALVLGAPFAGIPMFMALIVPLSIAATVNVILAEILMTIVGAYVIEKE